MFPDQDALTGTAEYDLWIENGRVHVSGCSPDRVIGRLELGTRFQTTYDCTGCYFLDRIFESHSGATVFIIQVNPAGVEYTYTYIRISLNGLPFDLGTHFKRRIRASVRGLSTVPPGSSGAPTLSRISSPNLKRTIGSSFVRGTTLSRSLDSRRCTQRASRLSLQLTCRNSD